MPYKDQSPAMTALRAKYRHECSRPELHDFQKHQHSGERYLDMIGELVHADAEMTEKQMSLVLDLVFTWSNQHFAPSIMDRMVVATFINTCRK